MFILQTKLEFIDIKEDRSGNSSIKTNYLNINRGLKDVLSMFFKELYDTLQKINKDLNEQISKYQTS